VDSLDSLSNQIGQALDQAGTERGITIDYYMELNQPANHLDLFVFSDVFQGKEAAERYQCVMTWIEKYAPEARTAISTILTMTQSELKAYRANPPISGAMVRFGSLQAP